MDKINLSIIIPCFNEAENIPKLIKHIKSINDKSVEIILVDNGSNDNTKKALSNNIDFKIPIIKVISIKENIGYGHGIMKGVRKSTGKIVAWTHADLQTDVNDIIKAHEIMLKNNSQKNCIVKGVRTGRSILDSFFTYGMSLIVSIVMRMRLSDVNAQPKIFDRNFLDKLIDAPDDFSLDLYFLYQAKINDYNILEFPVKFKHRYKGKSKGGGSIIGKIRLIWRTLKYILKLRKVISYKNGNHNS